MLFKQPLVEIQFGPFQGITDVHYRNVFQNYFTGIDKFFTPFFSGIQKENSKNLKTDEINPLFNDINHLIPQLLSNDSAEILRFAEQCKTMGYNEVNLNMGCPYPQVALKKRGSGLMPYTEMVAKMMNELKGNLPLAFSIKCRLGYHNSTELEELLPYFNSVGLKELIVHARLGKQMYGGVPDQEKFAAIIPLSDSPVVYNGDIFTVDQFKAYQQKFPEINKWMLGRGILSDPFLASDIKGTTSENDMNSRKEIVYQFITSLYLKRRKVKADNPAILGRMKELWSYLHWSFDDPATAWRMIRKVGNFEDYEETVAYIVKHQQWVGSGFIHSASSKNDYDDTFNQHNNE